MIEIDGSAGGQVLRSSVALSALLGKPIKVVNVRSQRDQPGLKEQHLAAVMAVASACGAEVSGGEVGSRTVGFVPGEISRGRVRVRIGSSGSIGLVMQALLPVYIVSGKASSIEINGGGTAGKWSPPVDYMEMVLLEILRMFGADVKVNVLKHGFYPKGGADVQVNVGCSKMEKIDIVETGKLIGIDGVSVASRELSEARVAERQKTAALKVLEDAKVRTNYVSTLSTGSYVVLRAVYEKTVVGADFLGERGLRSEEVGKSCAELLKSHFNCAVDPHAADNMIPYVALLGGKFRCGWETEHIKSNMKTCSEFG